MKFSRPKSRKLLIDLSIFTLTGFITGTAIIFMLISEKIGAMKMPKWQMAVIYIVMVVASVWLGMNKHAKEGEGGQHCANN